MNYTVFDGIDAASQSLDHQVIFKLGTTGAGQAGDHPEAGTKATKIEVSNFQNLLSTSTNKVFQGPAGTTECTPDDPATPTKWTCDCETDGQCFVKFSPVTTNFVDLPANGAAPERLNAAFNDDYGWARLDFKMTTSLNGVPDTDLWAVNAESADIYFKPIPVPVVGSEAPYAAVLTEDFGNPLTVSLIQGSTPDTHHYTHGGGLDASDIRIWASSTPNLVNPGGCDPQSSACEYSCTNDADSPNDAAKCSLIFNPAVGGVHTFKYLVKVDGVWQVTPGEIKMFFKQIPTVTPIVKTNNLEGVTVETILYEEADFKVYSPSEDAKELVIMNPGSTLPEEAIKGTFDYTTNSGTSWTQCDTDEDLNGDSFNEVICPCDNTAAQSKCHVRYNPSPAWDTGVAADTIDRVFVYKIRDNEFNDENGAPLISLDGNLTIQYTSKIIANSGEFRDVVENLGASFTTLKIQRNGNGAAFEPNYIDRNDVTASLPNTAVNIKITALNNLTLDGTGESNTCDTAAPSIATPCIFACTAGSNDPGCQINLRSLQDAAFQAQGTFDYFIDTGSGIESRKAATATVKFIPLTYGEDVSRMIPFSSTLDLGTAVATKIEISLNDGYRHITDNAAATWRPLSDDNATQQTGADATLANWSCDNATGICGVDVTPNAKATGAADTHTFQYEVSDFAAGLNRWGAPATLTFTAFPRPQANNKTLYWTENAGDKTAAAGEEYRVNFELGAGKDVEHDYAPNLAATAADAIQIKAITGGTASAVTCPTTTLCHVDITVDTDNVSASNQNPAITITYDAAVDDGAAPDDEKNFRSNEGTIQIVIMPELEALATTQEFEFFDISGAGTPESFTFTIGRDNTADLIAYNHPWTIGLDDAADITITQQPTFGGNQVGTLTVDSCASGQCTLTYTATKSVTDGVADQDISFAYDLKIDNDLDIDSTQNATIDNSHNDTRGYTAKLVSKPSYQNTGKTVTLTQGITGNVIDQTNSVSVSLAYGDGYTHADGATTAASISINWNQAIIDGFSDGATTANTTGFNNATAEVNNETISGLTASFDAINNFWGTIWLPYRVCKVDCSAEDTKSAQSDWNAAPNDTSWIKVVINPADQAPTVEANIKVVAYNNLGSDNTVIGRKVVMKLGVGTGTGTLNDEIWFDDVDNVAAGFYEDKTHLKKVSFPTTGANVNIVGYNGTTCAGIECTCVAGAEECHIHFVPTQGLTEVIQGWKVVATTTNTHSGVDTDSPETDFELRIRNPQKLEIDGSSLALGNIPQGDATIITFNLANTVAETAKKFVIPKNQTDSDDGLYPANSLYHPTHHQMLPDELVVSNLSGGTDFIVAFLGCVEETDKSDSTCSIAVQPTPTATAGARQFDLEIKANNTLSGSPRTFSFNITTGTDIARILYLM